MRAFIIAATAAAVGFALPAAAQQNNGSWNDYQHNQQQGYDGGSHQSLQQKIRQDLGEAGFTDIRVVPRSFVVSARDRDGNPVEMMITPNSITAMTAGIPNRNGPGANGQNYSQNEQNGWNNGSGYGQNGWNNQYGQNGPMGDNGMGNSDQSGNSINSPNGNGTYSR